MIKEDPFVELASLCSKTCHVLETVDDLGGFSEQIEDLGRYVGLACPVMLIITSGFRIVSNIEFAVRERAKCSIDLREHLRMSTEECINTWREELCGIMNFFYVRHC